MEGLSFAVGGELCCEDRLYVLGVAGEDTAEATGGCFDGRAIHEPSLPGFEIFMVDGGLDTTVDEVDVCEAVIMLYSNESVGRRGEQYHMEAMF